MLHRGFSLIEMLVVITVGSVVVGIGVGTLHVLHRTEQTGRDRAAQARIVDRLAQQFRSDVAAAVRQTPAAQQGEWQFVLPLEGRFGSGRRKIPGSPTCDP